MVLYLIGNIMTLLKNKKFIEHDNIQLIFHMAQCKKETIFKTLVASTLIDSYNYCAGKIITISTFIAIGTIFILII